MTVAVRLLGERLILLAGLACLLVPCIMFAFLQPKLDPLSALNLQLSVRTNINIRVVEENTTISEVPGEQTIVVPLTLNADGADKTSAADVKSVDMPIEDQDTKITISDSEIKNPTLEEEKSKLDGADVIQLPQPQVSEEEEKEAADSTPSGTDMPKRDLGAEQTEQRSEIDHIEAVEKPSDAQQQQEEVHNNAAAEHVEIPESSSSSSSSSSISCDYSQRRSATCVVHGDVRIHAASSSVILAKSPPSSSSATEEATYKIRPYARKWEEPVLELIREFTVRASSNPGELPQCSAQHSVPAVVFSTGGFLGNFFHDFTDVLIPLFITSYQYKGEVQFLITNFNYAWVKKYAVILRKLSNYEIINLDRDEGAHCFPHAQVGLLSHKELGVDPSKTPGGYSMAEFRAMLRSCFNLKRTSARVGGRKPRLLMLHRKGSRSITNRREVVAMARSVGFKVVAAGPEATRNVSRFAQLVNSCEVMMGVHGAGLTNMLFLPDDGAVIQVVPWGGLKYACNHDFGEPAPDMRVRYLEYEIKEEESSLIKQYPRNHPVFTDPMSIHNQGWNVLWAVFLNRQNIKVDVRRFRSTLQEALQGTPR